jgi:hypothetical protein
MDALTLPERSSSTGFIRLLWRHIRYLDRGGSAPPPTFVAFRSVSPIPLQCAYVLLRSYYSLQRFLSKSVVKSSARTTAISPSEAKATVWVGFATVRGLKPPWPVFSSPNVSRFWAKRCLGAEPKLFLWNSLIKPPRVGDVFKGMVAWDFSVFQKAKLGSVFSKSPTVETPKVNRRSSHRFQVGVGS